MQNKQENSDSIIFYWNGIIDPLGLAPVYLNTLQNLMNGNYHGLNFEKLVGHDVYSVRRNNADRLLFTKIMVQGKPYLMLLDVVLNHDYAKSRFLKAGVLKNYLDLHGQMISEVLVNNHFKACTEKDIPLSDIRPSEHPAKLSRVDFHNKKFIVLDTIQREAITQRALPLVISGAPGSGKSCIALQVLAQYIASHHNDEYSILYVTESESLATNMNCAWQDLPIAHNLAADAVQFKSYQQLIKTFHPGIADKAFVDKKHFIKWLSEHIKTERIRVRVIKEDISFDSFIHDMDAVYQEFRIISGYQTEAAYCKSGQRQSLFHEGAEKKWLFQAYGAYQTQLEQDGCIHVPFYPLNLQNQFKLIVVDEAQDLSMLQLHTLASLATKRQICFCEDNRQSLSDNKSKIPFLKGLMHTWNMQDNFLTLSTSYRCPEAVIHMANTVSYLKSIVTGYGEMTIEIPEGQANKQGTVMLLNSADELGEMLGKIATSTSYAVITTQNNKEAAQNKYNTELVFTIDEIKGQEFPNIIMDGLFDNSLFEKADKLIGEQASEFSKKSGHRAKHGQGHEKYGPLFSMIFTAVTRAMGALYIVQEKKTKIPHIYKALTEALPSVQVKPEIICDSEDKKQDWFKQCKNQLNLGNYDTAEKIYINRLDKSAVKFEEFKADFLKPEPVAIPVIMSEIKPAIPLKPEPKLMVPSIKNNAPQRIMATKNPVSSPTVKAGALPDNKQANLEAHKKINELLKKITIKTLMKFFKDAKACDYLYHIPVENESCLFRLLFDKKYPTEDLLFCLLKFPKLLERGITKNILCEHFTHSISPLYCLLSTSNGKKVLDKILTKNKNFAESIDFVPLCFLAATVGDTPVFMELMKYTVNVDVNTADANGCTLVYTAAGFGHIAILDILAKLKANMNAANNAGFTPTYIAAQKGYAFIISVLAKYGADLNKCTSEGNTPAHSAVDSGHTSVLIELAQQGANLNIPNNNGCTPLYIAAHKGNIAIIAEFIRHKIDLNTLVDSNTAVHIAASADNAAVIAILAEHGATLDKPNNRGITPAIIAAKSGYISVLEVLIKWGADVSLPYKDSVENLRELAESLGTEIAERINRFLMKQHVTSDKQIISISPYDIACMMGYEDIIKLLSRYNKSGNEIPEITGIHSHGFFTTNTLDVTPELLDDLVLNNGKQ